MNAIWEFAVQVLLHSLPLGAIQISYNRPRGRGEVAKLSLSIKRGRGARARDGPKPVMHKGLHDQRGGGAKRSVLITRGGGVGSRVMSNSNDRKVQGVLDKCIYFLLVKFHSFQKVSNTYLSLNQKY